MAAVSGLGTTYNLPNYTGLLYQITPTETPFFSAIGGWAALATLFKTLFTSGPP